MKNNKLAQFINNNPDVHEIFHEGYEAGLKTGFIEAIERSCRILELMKEIQEDR